MKYAVLLIVASLLFGAGCHFPEKDKPTAVAQKQELFPSPQYDKSDLEQLKHTADSLNLKFRTSVVNPVYHSIPQTEALAVELNFDKKNLTRVKGLLKKSLSPQQIKQVIPDLIIKDSAHVILAYETRYERHSSQYFHDLYAGYAGHFRQFREDRLPDTEKWIYKMGEGATREGKAMLYAYLPDRPFSSIPLPKEYARMIQYVDCMLDTTINVMPYIERKKGTVNQSFKKLTQYILTQKIPLDLTKEQLKDYDDYPDFDILSDNDRQCITEYLNNNSTYLQLLQHAIREALTKKLGTGDLYALAIHHYQKDTLLLLARTQRVHANCAEDFSIHAHKQHVAELAAQARQWPVFINAHLDVMDHYYRRLGMTIYAAEEKGAYLRELEFLDIPVLTLLLGTILSARDLSIGHYQGNPYHIGRAFADLPDTTDFEKRIGAYMHDDRLDPFNRSILYMLYERYCYNQTNKSLQKLKTKALKSSAATYPEYIRIPIEHLD
jgi:hypothetical protein